jgi:hypothetical protein
MTKPNQAHFVYDRVAQGNKDECWPWKGRLNDKGYGCFDIDNKYVLAHRFIYELEHGKVPDGLEVMHLCHNRTCCNPKHLKAGTHAENMKTRKGKLTKDEIAEIRDSHLPQAALAELYSVHQSTISRIIKHKRLYRDGSQFS